MLSTTKKGRIGELAVAMYLLNQGLEVFENVAADGPADLVAWNINTGKMALVDSKTQRGYIKKNGDLSFSWKAANKNDQVFVLFINEQTGELYPQEGLFEQLGLDIPEDD